MEKVKKSEFSFEGLYIKESHIKRDIENSTGNFSFDIIPSGTIFNEKKEFILNLVAELADENNSFEAKIHAVATFRFNEVISNDILENYFYINAPAIVFPYLRAYITSLTSLMGHTPVILPLLNMTNLKENLKNNTITK